MSKILLIDDDIPLLELLTTTINKNIPDIEVISVNSAEKGIDFIRNNSDVSLVVTDIVLPEKAGIHVIVSLKQNNPDISIFAMSGDSRISTAEYLNLAAKLGASEVFIKPINRSLFIKKLKTVLKIN